MTLDLLFELHKDLFPNATEWNNLIIKYFDISFYVHLFPLIEKSIKYYDKSKNVNVFYYKDKLYWLDKDTRIGLVRLIDSGASDITLLLNDIYINIKAIILKLFLDKLEVYAGKCFSTTAQHLQELYKCHTLEELLLLDYTSNYPEKLVLDVD